MAAKKKQTTAKKDSRFYVANTMASAKGRIESRVSAMNEKFIKKQVESGKKLYSELKENPMKRIDDMIGEGKESLKKAKKTRMDSLNKTVDTTKKDIQKKYDTLSEKTQEIYKGLENDAKLIIDDALELGKKNLDKLPLKKTVKEKITKGVDAIPAKLNLPSKEEIDNLLAGIDGVNKKVDALNRKYAKA